jgi:DNA (cytosine-5)-methyltransferase 1
MRSDRKAISLFSGAMGLDIGIESKGFQYIACNEIDPTAIATIKKNKPHIPVLDQSIEELSVDDFSQAAGFDVRNIDVLTGGPPCQPFSVFGQRRGLDDHRGRLIFEFVRLVSEIQPKTFVMENVRGLHSMPMLPSTKKKKDTALTRKGSLLEEIFRRFEADGYRVDCFLVNAANYGAPQIRERLICIGNRFNLHAKFPEPKYSNRPHDRLPRYKTLGDAIGGRFKDQDPSLMNFSERKLKYLSMIPPGGNWRSLPIRLQKESMGKSWYLKGGRSAYWRKLSMEFPCPTVVTMPNHAGTSMCHPTELRALTVGEMAAVQEFPKTWKFVGSPTDKCRQIGNAVPVRLGNVVGETVKQLLSEIGPSSSTKKAPVAPSKITHIRPHVRTKTYYRDGKAYAGDHSYYDDAKSNTRQFESQLPFD